MLENIRAAMAQDKYITKGVSGEADRASYGGAGVIFLFIN